MKNANARPSGLVPRRLHFWRLLRERSQRGARSWAVGAIILACMAAGSKAIVDLMRLRDAGHVAREAAADRRGDVQNRINAIVVGQRQVLELQQLWRELEQEGGPVGEQARNALKATTTR